jgi:hypothetical protein
MADNHSSSLETALSNDSSSPTGEPKKHYDQQASVQLDFEVGSKFYTLQIDHVFQVGSRLSRRLYLSVPPHTNLLLSTL